MKYRIINQGGEFYVQYKGWIRWKYIKGSSFHNFPIKQNYITYEVALNAAYCHANDRCKKPIIIEELDL